MPSPPSRRDLLIAGGVATAGSSLGLARPLLAQAAPGIDDGFPSQLRQRVYDTVLYAHSDIDKVRTLVTGSPALANAAMDWGFGDWESALGAASHMGRRDIAELLLEHGARPDLFTHAMLGHLEVVRGLIAAMPGVEATFGPHGISLLSHAQAGGEEAAAVADYLEALGTADPQQASEPLLLDTTAYVGEYGWADDGGQPLIVEEGRGGNLRLRRGDGFGRNLFHLGDHAFHPGGAPAVRIRFDVNEGAVTGLRIVDGAELVAAQRKPPQA